MQEGGSDNDAAVGAWLRDNDLAEFQGAFSRAGVGREMLGLLGDEELRQMGIAALGPKRRILAAIQASLAPQVASFPHALSLITSLILLMLACSAHHI